MSPNITNTHDALVVENYSGGLNAGGYTNYKRTVVPVVFLSSNIVLNGEGSASVPYTFVSVNNK